MTVRSILMGMVVGLVLPLAGANARAVIHPGLSATGGSADFERGVAPTAADFRRDEDDQRSDQGGNDNNDHHDHSGDGDHHGDDDHHGDNDHRCDQGGGLDHHCDKSPSRPE